MSYNSPYDRAHKGSIKIYRKIQNRLARLERENCINKYIEIVLDELVKTNEGVSNKFWYECIANENELMQFAIQYLPNFTTKEQSACLSIVFEQIKKIFNFGGKNESL